MMTTNLPPGGAPVSLDEVRAWLRLGSGIDDAVIAPLIATATSLCEAFIGQWLIVRAVDETLPRRGATVTLTARPVVAVDSVSSVADDGAMMPLAHSGWQAVIDRDGSARLRLTDPGGAARLRVAYRAGMADSAGAIPDALRHGILRMIQHLYGARDGGDTPPPAAVSLLWQPWRRVALVHRA